VREKQPRSPQEARAIIQQFVERYNSEQLHSAIGFVTPRDALNGRQESIWEARDTKLETAREKRRLARLQSRQQDQAAA